MLLGPPVERWATEDPETGEGDELRSVPMAFLPDKPERHGLFWCGAHEFCRGERLPGHEPDCARER